jgi:hypothetical protein
MTCPFRVPRCPSTGLFGRQNVRYRLIARLTKKCVFRHRRINGMRDGGSEAHVRAALWAWRWRVIAHRAEPHSSRMNRRS